MASDDWAKEKLAIASLAKDLIYQLLNNPDCCEATADSKWYHLKAYKEAWDIIKLEIRRER